MKIEQINAKLKHKILKVDIQPQSKSLDEDESITISKHESGNSIAILQMSNEWLKFVLKGSANTYLVEYSKIEDKLVDNFITAQALDQKSLMLVAQQWTNANPNEVIHPRYASMLPIDENKSRDMIHEIVQQRIQTLAFYANLLNGSNRGEIPGQALGSVLDALNSPIGLHGNRPIEGTTYVVVSNSTPFAVSISGSMSGDVLQLEKLVDPLVWFGVLLEDSNGSIDDPNVPLGITA